METIVKKVSWVNTIDGTLGFVTIDNGFDIKTYVKLVKGMSEKDDIVDVYENGGEVPNRSSRTFDGLRRK